MRTIEATSVSAIMAEARELQGRHAAGAVRAIALRLRAVLARTPRERASIDGRLAAH